MRRFITTGLLLINLLIVGGLQQAYASETLPDTVEVIAAELGFTAAERWQLYQGNIVVTDLPELSEKMLAQAVAVVLPAGIDNVAKRLLSGNIIETDRDVIAFGRIDPKRIEASFAGVLFGRDDAEEIEMLQDGQYDQFNLSTSEIAAFKALGDVSAVEIEKTYRKLLVMRAKAYIEKGLAGIAAYARDGGKKTQPSQELKSMASTLSLLDKHETALYRAFLHYPNNQPAGIDTAFFWIKKLAGGRPVLTLAHRIIKTEPNKMIVMRREFYVGHSFNAEQTVSGFFPLQQGAIVFSSNRTTSDQVAGFASGLRHSIGRDMMRDTLVKRFTNIRKAGTS